MSLGIAFKGAEGVVLAADSRVTLLAQMAVQAGPGQPPAQLQVPATYDNATKLLSVKTQPFVAAVTYGVGVIDMRSPRTAASFMPEFDAEIAKEKRLTVEAFAQKLSDFFMRHWTAANMPKGIEDMVFLVGGYDDEKSPYGKIFQVGVPSSLKPVEILPGPGQFGAAWGGQREHTDRLLQGFDPRLSELVQEHLNVPIPQRAQSAANLENFLRGRLNTAIPWQFLPLQDCVDLSIFLIRTTITIQKWLVGIRGVGGAIDVGTITRTDGFRPIQQKSIVGEQI
jgi:hypothetical protein